MGGVGGHGSIRSSFPLGNAVLCAPVAVASTILVKGACSSSSICTWRPCPTSSSLSVGQKSLQFASTSVVFDHIYPVALACVFFECGPRFLVFSFAVAVSCCPQSSNSLLTLSCVPGYTRGYDAACCPATETALRRRGTCTSSVTSPLPFELSVFVLR